MNDEPCTAALDAADGITQGQREITVFTLATAPGPGTDLVTAGPDGQNRAAPATTYLSGLVGERKLRLGSRTSPMAMAQAQQVAALLTTLVPGLDVAVTAIATSADQWAGDLAALGGKGAFTKTIDRALLLGEIDAAVHCVKDVPGDVPLPDGLAFAAYLPREDIRDCLVFPLGSGRATLDDLPAGARIGTSSVRRKAQLGRHRPDLAVHRIRGNVNSRLLRLDAGEFDALVLARAGLARIGMVGRAAETFDTDVMCPAVGAGVIGIQCRVADKGLLEVLRMLDNEPARIHVSAERTMLHCLQGHCNSPIAGFCSTTPDGQLALRGMVFTRDGGEFVHAMEWGRLHQPAELGAYVAGVLLRKGARDLINGIPH
jgi:hydroxymethylbilane synthase